MVISFFLNTQFIHHLQEKKYIEIRFSSKTCDVSNPHWAYVVNVCPIFNTLLHSNPIKYSSCPIVNLMYIAWRRR